MSQKTGLSNELDLLGWLILYGNNKLTKEEVNEQLFYDYTFCFRLRGKTAIQFLKFVTVSKDPMSLAYVRNMGYSNRPHEMLLDYLYTLRNFEKAKQIVYRKRRYGRVYRKGSFSIACNVGLNKKKEPYLFVDIERFTDLSNFCKRIKKEGY